MPDGVRPVSMLMPPSDPARAASLRPSIPQAQHGSVRIHAL